MRRDRLPLTQIAEILLKMLNTINQPKPSNYCRKKLLLVNREIPLKPNVMWSYEVLEYESGIYTLGSRTIAPHPPIF